MITLILTIAVFGFIAWLVLQIPMPAIFRSVLLGVMCLLLVVWVLQVLGVPTGLPRLRQ